jgi:N-acetylmuramoyl-L-alanine amidase
MRNKRFIFVSILLMITLLMTNTLDIYGLTVAVDDGHGQDIKYKATPDGYLENTYNQKVKEYLTIELKRNGFNVIDCSPETYDTPLHTRVYRANNGKADIFVSIHYNAFNRFWQTYASGVEVYYHKNGPKSKVLAQLVQDELLKGSKQKDRGIRSDTTIFSSGFYVLRNTKMPAILTEAGYMDNKLEGFALMRKDSYQKECAIEIAKGICKYFNKTYIPAYFPELKQWESRELDQAWKNKIITDKNYWKNKMLKDDHVSIGEVLAMLNNLYEASK